MNLPTSDPKFCVHKLFVARRKSSDSLKDEPRCVDEKTDTEAHVCRANVKLQPGAGELSLAQRLGAGGNS